MEHVAKDKRATVFNVALMHFTLAIQSILVTASIVANESAK